jgi:hypothetical protein
MEGVFWGEEFVKVTGETIEDQGRWTTHYSQVLQHRDTGAFWLAEWDRGSTEYQETDPDLSLVLVEPVEVTKVEYKKVSTTKQV